MAAMVVMCPDIPSLHTKARSPLAPPWALQVLTPPLYGHPLPLPHSSTPPAESSPRQASDRPHPQAQFADWMCGCILARCFGQQVKPGRGLAEGDVRRCRAAPPPAAAALATRGPPDQGGGRRQPGRCAGILPSCRTARTCILHCKLQAGNASQLGVAT